MIGRMIKFAPRWNWRSLILITVSFVFWLLFAGVIVFLVRACLARDSNHLDRNSIGLMFVTATMILGALFWLYGLVSFFQVHYSVETEGDSIVWKVFRPWRVKEHRMPLAAISGFGISGHPRTGLSLEIKVGRRTRRLGLLLSSGDIQQLMLFIEGAKARHEETGPAADTRA
jgi:hypothetical protein